MTSLLLFDVDGTIAESGEQVSDEMLKLFMKLSLKYDLGIVGGGKFEKIIDQLRFSTDIRHIFSECGCVYHKRNVINYDCFYKKNLREHTLYPKINILVKTALRFLSTVKYTITGNFIDLRNGIIYISLIGMAATQEERKYFMELDKEQHIREHLINILQDKSLELQIENDIKILEGGSVGIGIYPKEYGKGQALDYLEEYKTIYYFGDKYLPNGNDYELIVNPRTIGYMVDSVEDTKKILYEFL
jgi:phosphomannomutase